MFRACSSAEQDERLYIDPKCLDLRGTGGWIDDLVPQPGLLEESYETDTANRQGALPDPEYRPSQQHGTPHALFPAFHTKNVCRALTPSSHSSSLNPDARVFVPHESLGRHAKASAVAQEPVGDQQDEDDPPTTPLITVQNVTDAAAFPIAITVERSTASSGQKSRGRNSSSTRPMRHSIRQNIGFFHLSSPSRGAYDQLLSPETWLLQNSYDIETTSGKSKDVAVPMTPAASPASPTPNLVPSSPAVSLGNGPYFCTEKGCKQPYHPFSTKSDLRHHTITHLEKWQRPHACPECGDRFHYPKDVRRHMRRKNHGGKSVICQICNKALSRDDNMTRHLGTQHSITHSPTFVSDSPSSSRAVMSSPAMSSVSASFSDAAYGSYTSPSTPGSLSLSLARSGSYHPVPQPLPRLGETDTLSVCEIPPRAPTSALMARWHTN